MLVASLCQEKDSTFFEQNVTNIILFFSQYLLTKPSTKRYLLCESLHEISSNGMIWKKIVTTGTDL